MQKKQFITGKVTTGARKINKAKLDHELKETRQQYHTVFNATNQQIV